MDNLFSNTEFLSVGKCPKCGRDLIKTSKGYKCQNAIGDNPSCDVSIPFNIGNRKMIDDEIITLVQNRALMLDGFIKKDGKVFSTVLRFDNDGKVNFNSKIAVCPKCGGDILVSNRSFYCSNFAREVNPCNFTIWRNISGHWVSSDEAIQICQHGATSNDLLFYKADGTPYSKKLGLNAEKDVNIL